MQIAVKNIPIEPSFDDPRGQNSHLLRVSVRHDEEINTGVMREPMYLVYSKKHNSLSPVTEDYAGILALNSLFFKENVETSLPKNLQKEG